MQKNIILLLMCCMLVATASCTTFQASGLEVPRMGGASSGALVGPLDINVKVSKFLGSSSGVALINSGGTDPLIVEAIQREVARMGGSRAINVRIHYRATFVDYLLNTFTGFIYAPTTARVTGMVVR